MTDMPNENGPEETGAARAQAPSGDASEHSANLYESAGIAEHDGRVPVWLWAVAVSLAIWGIYYLVTYWNAPVATWKP